MISDILENDLLQSSRVITYLQRKSEKSTYVVTSAIVPIKAGPPGQTPVGKIQCIR